MRTHTNQLFRWLVYPAVLSLVLSAGCWGRTKVASYTLRARDLNYRILATFTVNNPAPLTMVSNSGGTVQSILAKEGDKVREGQVLVQLDDFTQRQNLTIATSALETTRLKQQNASQELRPKLVEQRTEQQATLNNARTDYLRSKRLLSIGAIAPIELEQAHSKYQKALSEFNQTNLTLKSFSASGAGAALRSDLADKTAKLALAQKELTDKRLVAPFNAVISAVSVQVGQNLQPNTPVIVVIEDQVPTLELDIDQKELPYLKNDLTAAVTFDAHPDHPVSARVVYVCTDINTEKGTCRVRLLLKEAQPFVKFGMTGTAEIATASYPQVLAVPAQFFERAPEGVSVWRWDGRQASRQAVTPRSVGERWAIVDSLPAGTKLLLPQKSLSPDRVKPGKEEDPTP